MDEKGEEEQKQPESNSENAPEVNNEAEDHSTADYANYQPPQKEHSPIWRKLGIGLTILIAIVLLGAGAMYLKNHKSTKKPAESSQTAQTTASTPAASQIATTTKHYDSSAFQLAFDYPQDWTVSDNGNGILTVTSPKLQLKSADGQTVSGRIIMTIRDSAQKLTEFNAGNALAAKASVKIAYTKPSPSQRGSTYESFLRYANTANTAGLDGVYITGDSGYTLGQAIPLVDVQKVSPVINITFVKCADSVCTAKTTPLSIASTAWDDKTFSQPLESMLQSLTIN